MELNFQKYRLTDRVRGGAGSKKNGGGEKGLDWCMIKAGVRYNRILDPAHVLSTRGGQGGRNEMKIITGRDALLKMSNRVILFHFFLVLTRWDPVLKNPIKGSFIHSFIYSNFHPYLGPDSSFSQKMSKSVYPCVSPRADLIVINS